MIRQTKTKENICMQEGKVKTISHLCRLNNSYSCLGKTVNSKELNPRKENKMGSEIQPVNESKSSNSELSAIW